MKTICSKIVCSVSVVLFLAFGAGAQTAGERALIDLDAEIQTAIVDGDANVIGRFVADDLIFVHGFLTGPTETKKDFLAAAKLDPKPYIYRRVSAQVAEIHGKFGMVIGRLDIRRRPNAKNNETAEMCYALNFVHLFERKKKRWQLVSHRAAQVLQPPTPCVDPK